MTTTGFVLREAIRRWELRRDTAASQFSASLHAFAGETKTPPDDIAAAFLEAEDAIARLQEAQTRYNLAVTVNVGATSQAMTLCQAVKRLGGAGRMDKLWRGAVGDKPDRYSVRDDLTRREGETRAERVMSPRDAMTRANSAAVYAGALRAAIAKGNGTDVPLDAINLRPELLTE